MKILHIEGRRWFSKSKGSTYHAVEIYVDGVCVDRATKRYGYGMAYEETAFDLLKLHNLIPDYKEYPSGVRESLSRYCSRKGITFISNVTEVGRRKDL